MQTKTKQTDTKAAQTQISAETQLAVRMLLLLQLARTYPAPLAKQGYGKAKRAALAKAVQTYQKAHKAWVKAKADRTRAAGPVQALCRDVLECRKAVRDALRLIGKDGGPIAPPVRDRSSVAKNGRTCIGWLDQIRPIIEALAEELSGYVKNPLARVDSLQTTLTGAMVVLQAAEGGTLSASREALAAARTELARQASVLRFFGRLAFKGQPDVLHRLNLKVLRHARKTEAEAAAAPRAANDEKEQAKTADASAKSA